MLGDRVIKRPYLLFLGDAHDDLAAKTARGILEWRSEWCLGQICLEGCQTTLDIENLTLDEAVERGAKSLIVGVANRGGVIPTSWVDTLIEAVIRGMDVASGLHNRLTDIPALREMAERHMRELFDVRHPAREFELGTGRKRTGKRLLTVGTDASVGKMYTTLALEKELRWRGMNVDFRATGQTGILIAGSGVCVDAVVADFISGATEWLTPDNDPDHWDLVEGQGSLHHPSFAGVTLGLIHGAQPDAIVLCHEPTRTHMRGLPGWPLPDLKSCVEANLEAARLVNPDVRCVGVSLNTAGLDREAGARLLAETEERLGVPCVDPKVTDVRRIADRLS